MPSTTLTRREINRATLARQMLLAREKTTALDAIERLLAMTGRPSRVMDHRTPSVVVTVTVVRLSGDRTSKAAGCAWTPVPPKASSPATTAV